MVIASGILVSAVGQWAGNRELLLKSSSLRQTAEATSLALQGIVTRHDYLPYVIAQHPDIQSLLRHQHDSRMNDRVNQYLADLEGTTGSAALFLVNREGNTLAASNWGRPNSFVGQSYRRRPYFEEALQGRRGVFYGLGLTTGIPGLFIAEPVRSQGEIIGVVVVKLSLETLENAWSRSLTPMTLQDARGIVFLSSVPEWLYKSERPLTDNDLEWLSRNGQYGNRQSYPLLPWQSEKALDDSEFFILKARWQARKREFLALPIRIPELGWRLTVTSDFAEIRQSRREAQIIATLACALMLLGTLYWRLRERRYLEQQEARVQLEQRVQERTKDLQEAHAFQKSMEDSLLVGMRARDPEGKIIYVNPALCEIVGYRQEELLGLKPPYPYWHPDDFEKHMQESDGVLQGKAKPHGFESRVRHRDGRDVITMVYTAPLIDAEGRHRGWMSSVVDITAQKQSEARQREQERQLQRSARLASVGEMASTLAHELNQPLMALSNFALAARSMLDASASGMLVSALDEIIGQSTRAGEIIKRVRAFINPNRGTYENLDMESVITHALALLQPELRRNAVSVNTGFALKLPMVRGDRVLLEQVLVNLVQNATQAMQSLPRKQRMIEIEAFRQENSILVTVSDHGPGIPEASSDQLFSPFFSTKSEGLGLGLSICRTIIEAHGGHVSVRNMETGGATFSIALPASR